MALFMTKRWMDVRYVRFYCNFTIGLGNYCDKINIYNQHYNVRCNTAGDRVVGTWCVQIKGV